MNRSERIAVRILQLGAVAVVLAATTHRSFDLDRFLMPKEIVLHATAALAALFAIGAIRRMTITRVDQLLMLFLLLSLVSGLFATSWWLAGRAFAISASGILLYWTGRSLENWRPRILNGLALAVVLAAVVALVQAYGGWIDLFSTNRAPGGTLGNRNFVAHAAAFGFPVVALAALRGNVFASFGVTITTAVLVLTRSRAAWLAFAAAATVFLIALVVRGSLRRDLRTWRRLTVMLVLVGGGVAAALLIPNDLNWRSDNPYLESVQGVVNYQEGSGRGRLIQYQRSLVMAAYHPVLGVGPGNWAVDYPDYATRHDPSLDTSEGGMTFNPWPSSDWVAFVSERGFAAAAILAAALVMMAFHSFRRRAGIAADEQFGAVDDSLVGATMLASLAAACVAGLFDAVLLLPLPAFLVWTTLGALSPPADPPPPDRSRFGLAAAVLIVFAVLGAIRSSMQVAAMELYTRGGGAALRQAAKIDPGNYRVRLRLADRGGKDRCRHALAARGMFPNAQAARAAARGCGD